jgi:hypothetical protein
MGRQCACRAPPPHLRYAVRLAVAANLTRSLKLIRHILTSRADFKALSTQVTSVQPAPTALPWPNPAVEGPPADHTRTVPLPSEEPLPFPPTVRNHPSSSDTLTSFSARGCARHDVAPQVQFESKTEKQFIVS